MNGRSLIKVATAALVTLAACGEPQFQTPEELAQAAPPEWSPTGVTQNLGEVSFEHPAGWETTEYTDGLAVRSPASAGPQCEVFVLLPRPAAVGETARYQQLLTAAQALFPQDAVLQDQYGGADALTHAWRGGTGRGWSYVGLINTVYDQTVDVLSFLADFGGTAVPVVMIEPRGSTWDCVNSLGDFGVEAAVVFHTVRLGGASPPPAGALEDALVGGWFSSDGTAASRYVFGANGRYIDTAVYGGEVEVSPGEWRDEYATWSGTGRYVVRGDLLGLFPEGEAAISRHVRRLEFRDSQGQWYPRLCWVAAYEGDPYTHCLGADEG